MMEGNGVRTREMEKEAELLRKVERNLLHFPGKIGFYYKNLVSGETLSVNAEEPFLAASVIKIPVMISAFLALSEGRLSREERHVLLEEEKLPSCGALNCLDAGISLSVTDLIRLMIVLSDNTATNILIRRLGMEKVNRDMEALGYHTCRLNRLLFDAEAAGRGLENRVSAAEIADMLKRMHEGKLIGKEASAEMLEILKNQKLNGKMPADFTKKTVIAHKTGEDSGISHDVGIVYGREPFVVCFLGNELESAPAFNRLIAETTWALCQQTESPLCML